MMHGHEKSRSAIVAVKPTNKAERTAAEPVERRAETKGNADQQRTRRTQRRISVSKMLARIRQHIVAVATQGGNRMRESCTYGSVRGARGNSRPYRDREGGGKWKTSSPTISASGRGRCRAPGRLAHRMGARLSDAARALIVGFAPGGATDIVARLIGQWLSERLGQQFLIENRPGAGSNIATEAVVRAPPDGYTLLLVTAANAINATSTKSSISISSATSRRSQASSACPRHGGESIGSGQDGPRVHRLCQGQSGQDQHGVGRHRSRRIMSLASCSR